MTVPNTVKECENAWPRQYIPNKGTRVQSDCLLGEVCSGLSQTRFKEYKNEAKDAAAGRENIVHAFTGRRVEDLVFLTIEAHKSLKPVAAVKKRKSFVNHVIGPASEFYCFVVHVTTEGVHWHYMILLKAGMTLVEFRRALRVSRRYSFYSRHCDVVGDLGAAAGYMTGDMRSGVKSKMIKGTGLHRIGYSSTFPILIKGEFSTIAGYDKTYRQMLCMSALEHGIKNLDELKEAGERTRSLVRYQAKYLADIIHNRTKTYEEEKQKTHSYDGHSGGKEATGSPRIDREVRSWDRTTLGADKGRRSPHGIECIRG